MYFLPPNMAKSKCGCYTSFRFEASVLLDLNVVWHPGKSGCNLVKLVNPLDLQHDP